MLISTTLNNYINFQFYSQNKEITSQVGKCKDHILSYFHKQTEKTLIRQLLEELPDLGLLCLQKMLKGVSMR